MDFWGSGVEGHAAWQPSDASQPMLTVGTDGFDAERNRASLWGMPKFRPAGTQALPTPPSSLTN